MSYHPSYRPLVWLWARDGADSWRRVGSFETLEQAAEFAPFLASGREHATTRAGSYPAGHCRRW